MHTFLQIVLAYLAIEFIYAFLKFTYRFFESLMIGAPASSSD
jgi:hypothetical protein